MKHKINWTHLLIIIVVCGGLMFITESFFMSLGILLLLFILDNFIKERARKDDENTE